MSPAAAARRHEGRHITSLTEQVSKLSASITSYLHANGHSEPDFTVDSAELPETAEYEALRNQFNDAVLDLHRLINGPKNIMRTQGYMFSDQAAMSVALKRKYFDIVPADHTGLSAAEVANKAGMDEDRTRRILKMLATQRIFEERGGRFRHTATSEFIRTSLFTGMTDVSFNEIYKAAADMDKHIEASPYESGLEKCAFYTRFGTTFYGHLEANPDRALVFSKAMRGWSLVDDSLKVLRNNFAWGSLKNTKVVDIGGGNGHISVDLAQHYPSLTFTVQDISTHQLSDASHAALKSRISFQKYDYNTPQPIHDAGVYLFRIAFHNNADAEAKRMIRAVLPALENRVDDPVLLINESIVPERSDASGEYGEGVTRAEEHQHRQLDLLMLGLFGAKERTERDWKGLFGAVDERLRVERVHYSASGAGLLEVRLRGRGGGASAGASGGRRAARAR